MTKITIDNYLKFTGQITRYIYPRCGKSHVNSTLHKAFIKQDLFIEWKNLVQIL